MKQRVMKQHVINLLDHYKAYGIVKYKDDFIEYANKFDDIEDLLDNVTVNTLFYSYKDETPTFAQTLLFTSTKIGHEIMSKLFTEELIDDILKENATSRNKVKVSFNDRYGI